MSYRDHPCSNCGRHRVELDGICEKCNWNEDIDAYAHRCTECDRPMANEDGYCSDMCRDKPDYHILAPLDVCKKCMFEVCKCKEFSSDRS